MRIKAIENYVLGLFIETILSNRQIVCKRRTIIGTDPITNLDDFKKEIIISPDFNTVLCLLKDSDNIIDAVAVFNLVNNNYVFNEPVTELIDGPKEILNISFSTSGENIVIIRRGDSDEGRNTSVNIFIMESRYVKTTITGGGSRVRKLSVPLQGMNSCLIGSTGILLHDGSGLLLLGDPLVEGRVVTEVNGFGTKGCIFLFKHIKNESISYVDQINISIDDVPNFNNYFIVDPDIKTNVKINYTPDGKGNNLSHNMRYLVDNIDNYRDINFSRYLKSNYK